MGLRFFADQCVPNAVIEELRHSGHEVLRLREHIPPDSPDTAVIATSQDLDALLLSLNADFVDIVTYPPSRYKGIVALQVRNHPEAIPHLLSRLKAYLSEHPEAAHYDGTLLLVEAHRIRIRR
jgi:predicted nuclease of predicted toxin-antitoxin system